MRAIDRADVARALSLWERAATGGSTEAQFALGIAYVVLVIIASVRANNGEFFRYPLTIRFIR